MRFIQTLPFVALATAFVLPDAQTLRQLATETSDEVHTLWDDISESADELFGSLKHKVSSVKHSFQSAIEEALEADIDDGLDLGDRPGHGHHGHHGHHDTSDYTIYQLIEKSEHTTNFTKLVNEFDDIVELLNSTKANYTLFVPVDSAFAHLPGHEGDKPPSREFVESVLRYHIGLDTYGVHRILTTQTIATALDEELLGGEPQRLRVEAGLLGVKVNFYSKVIAANFVSVLTHFPTSTTEVLQNNSSHPEQEAKNGVIHAVNHILVPPPFVGRELSLFPNVFSTLLLAYEKTDFVKFIHGVKTEGTTVFAPSNRAWSRLGPRANAFLFNTEKGLGYLKALLKYQIVANATLYSDAYYDAHDDTTVEVAEERHFDLTTLLHDLPIRVDIKRWGGFVRFWVNGFTPVVVRDGVAKNGVIHVVAKVPLPPHKHNDGAAAAGDDYGEVEVEDLMERLAPYVDQEEQEKKDDSRDWSDL
jgi:uncharacterized surface protein with fasciclin (FAS1) repeats